ncbi:MAG: TolC family protein [Bacteroidota bacterium]|nr:TolC family protein [Bacteroidota bacterium]
MKHKLIDLLAMFVMLIILVYPAKAQKQLSLQEAIRIGLEKNYQMQISELDVEIAQSNNAWGLAGRYPILSAGLRQNNRYDNQPSSTQAGQRSKFMTNSISPFVNLNWTLFDGFAVSISKDKLELLEQFTEGNAGVIVENTIQSIILAYYKVLLEKEKLQVLEEVKSLSSDRYHYMELKKEIGSSVTYDVLQAKNAFLNDSTLFLLQELNLKNALLNLHLLLADDAMIRYQLSDSFRFEGPRYQLSELQDKMMSDNKNLKNQYINLEILQKEISYQKSSLYPSLLLNAGADHYNTRMKFEDVKAAYTNSYDLYANLSLSFNLSNGGNVKRAIHNAELEKRIGELGIDELEHSLSNRLINFYDLYTIRKQLYEVSELNLESASLNLEISNEKFKSGAINSFNYRDVQLIYLNAAIGRLEAIYNLIDSHTELLRITGSIISEY